LTAWLDAVDPAGTMVLLGSAFTDVGQLAGRHAVGWRRPAWAAWEDKTVSLGRLRALGVATPAATVLTATADGAGTLPRVCVEPPWVVARGGTDRGGGSSLRVARTEAELAAVVAGAHAGPWRVSEYVEGRPCSIVGLVVAHAVVVFDPIEIVTLYDASSGRFMFCGSSSRWRPRAEAAHAMRTVARRVGTRMAEADGFSGGFSVDGVLGHRGFVATEVNARHASGLRLRHVWPAFPAYLFQRTVVEPRFDAVAICPVDLERAVRQRIVRHPSHSVVVPRTPDAPQTGRVELRDGRARACLDLGPTPNGGGVRVLSIEVSAPSSPDHAIGPWAARLAARLGRPEWTHAGEAQALDRPAPAASADPRSW
jgi:hypothetical protein